MKEIKFRVYSQIDKKFYYWGFIKGGFVGFPHSAELTIEYCRKHSQEYIGLRDKNKKEIYKGDVVKENHPDRPERICEVTWDDFRCKFVVSYIDDWIDDLKNIEYFGEVIGNIDENLKLLKGKE